MARQLKVAIAGGSLSGCTLATGLLQYEHIRFDVYESKEIFTERGQGVSISLNGENALREMGLPVEEMFERAGATVGDRPPCCIAAYGEHRGKHLFEQPAGWRYTVTRTRLLNELLSDIPEDRLHANKTLVSITEPVDSACPYVLHFEDGGTYEADVVIGCDGLFSGVRRTIFKGNDPDCMTPSFCGYWETRARTTPSKAAAMLGDDLFDPTELRKVGVAGEGGFMMFSPTDDGETYGIIMAARAGPNYDTSTRSIVLSREILEDSFQSWDTAFRDAVIECLLADQDGPGRLFSMWESGPTPTYCRDRLCIVGDAAHTMLPFMGQGANMAVEDAAVLAAVLGATRDCHELPAALMAYDKVRRGRPEFVMRHSRDVAKLVTGQYGLDPEKTAHVETDKWWDYAFNIDMSRHIQEALDALKSSVANGEPESVVDA